MVNFTCEPKSQKKNAKKWIHGPHICGRKFWIYISALLELDIKRGSHHDLSIDVGPYAALIRAALENKLNAIVGGPNCRSRSVLRHYKVPGQPDYPRPIKFWEGGEHGINGLTEAEKNYDSRRWPPPLAHDLPCHGLQLYQRSAKKTNPIGFSLEQPTSLKNCMPEVISFWHTKEWASLKKEFGWEETRFEQGQYSGSASKSTTFDGNLKLEVNNHKRMKKTGENLEVKSSKDLSRWVPGVMAMVAEALTTQIMQCNPILRPLSWDEHIAHGHTPYCRDYAVCQQIMQQCHPHRKIPYPIGGYWRSSFLGWGWTVDSNEGYWRSLHKIDIGWHSDMGSSSWIRKDERS